jgi:hypothetical protein
MKIDQEANMKTCQFQMADDLCFPDWKDVYHGLKLNDNNIFNQNVDSKTLIKLLIIIIKRKTYLSSI